MSSAWWRGCAVRRCRDALGQVGARRFGDRVDGGAPLFAAAPRLSRRQRAGLGAIGNVQGHGTPIAAGDRYAGDDIVVGFRALDGVADSSVGGRLVLGEG